MECENKGMPLQTSSLQLAGQSCYRHGMQTTVGTVSIWPFSKNRIRGNFLKEWQSLKILSALMSLANNEKRMQKSPSNLQLCSSYWRTIGLEFEQGLSFCRSLCPVPRADRDSVVWEGWTILVPECLCQKPSFASTPLELWAVGAFLGPGPLWKPVRSCGTLRIQDQDQFLHNAMPCKKLCQSPPLC